jgi:hypothetical protein
VAAAAPRTPDIVTETVASGDAAAWLAVRRLRNSATGYRRVGVSSPLGDRDAVVAVVHTPFCLHETPPSALLLRKRHCAKGHLLEGRSAVCEVASWHKADRQSSTFIHIFRNE